MTNTCKHWLKYGLLGIISLFYLLFAESVKAGCVQSDVNAQYAITSRNSPPPTQENTVNTQWGQSCLGNSSHGNNLQIYSGTGQVRQQREREVILNSEGWSDTPLQNTPNVKAEVDQPLHLPILLEKN